MTIKRDGQRVIYIHLSSARDPDGVDVDFFASEVTFRDPETDESILALSFEELADLDANVNSSPSMRAGVFFSADGDEWILRGVVTDGALTHYSPPTLVAGGYAFAAVAHGAAVSTRVLSAAVSGLDN